MLVYNVVVCVCLACSVCHAALCGVLWPAAVCHGGCIGVCGGVACEQLERSLMFVYVSALGWLLCVHLLFACACNSIVAAALPNAAYTTHHMHTCLLQQQFLVKNTTVKVCECTGAALA